MRRRPVSMIDRLHPLERWFARRTPAGIWIIQDEHGENPLRHLDPVARVTNVHLAAAAPLLRHELSRLLRRFRAVCRDDGTEHWKWNEGYIVSAVTAIFESRPLYTEICRSSEDPAQLELGWSEAA